jgi:hypothetical protein
MKRHEYEQEALQNILNKTPDDFTQDFTDGELRESLNDTSSRASSLNCKYK